MLNNNDLHNPDVLNCLANLSNDEVFTPPRIANQMLDLLPQEIWSNKEAKFLDPFCKSGVFLREVAKRLIKGLATEIPDLQQRVNHIMQHQIYGIGITELTALLSRRSLYCTKNTQSEHSVTDVFDNETGNIAFDTISHSWKNGKCQYCGVSKTVLGDDERQALETHAYQFIHNHNPFKNMQFDVIIGNPPYQLAVGNDGGNKSKAKAIYHLFIEQAIKMNPHYLCMIVPSRWMTKSTEGIPEEWVDNMLNSNKFIEIHDFLNASDVFPGVGIEGGVNYFIWDKDYQGECNYYLHTETNEIKHRYGYLDENKIGIVIRDIEAFGILEKVSSKDCMVKENFSDLVSPKDFFTNKQLLTSSWNGFSSKKTGEYCVRYYPNKKVAESGWVKETQIPKNIMTKDLHKVFIPAANGSQTKILGMPFYGEPNSVCSQTYLVIGYDPEKHHFTQKECEGIISYIKTKFFRYLVSIKKKTQNGARGVYEFVPLQDFNEIWTDEKLYKKYGLTEQEIEYIENRIQPMD